MVSRNAALIAAAGAAGVLWMVSFRTSGPSRLPVPVVGSRAAAQAPVITEITVKSLPDTGGDDDPWHHFEITVPPANPPLDMHVAFLVDGKGTETTTEQPQAWPQSMPFKYRLDSNDDGRVKAILQAQGIPVKANLITYHFAAGAYGWVGYNQTLHFKREPDGPQEDSGISQNFRGAVGEKIILDNRLISDINFKGDFDKMGDWRQTKFAPKTPSGMVHHLAVYLLFTPHHGPPVKGHQSISRNI